LYNNLAAFTWDIDKALIEQRSRFA
jgi:hypothetical protein